MKPPLFVSACLVGFKCRYDGEFKTDARVLRSIAAYSWIAVCPEQYAGLPTPRIPMAFEGGSGLDVLEGKARIVQVDGGDVTSRLVSASRILVRLAEGWRVRCAILKERSPSCGVTRIYVGDRLVSGRGVFAAMLAETGVTIVSEEQIVSKGEIP